jgi:hypothetical protein
LRKPASIGKLKRVKKMEIPDIFMTEKYHQLKGLKTAMEKAKEGNLLCLTSEELDMILALIDAAHDNEICKSVMNRAIKIYGKRRQSLKAQEEFDELSRELIRWLDTELAGKPHEGDWLRRMTDETADAIIMSNEVRLMFDIEKQVNVRIKEKIERLNTKLNKYVDLNE